MARSLSKVLASYASNALNKRGYTAASQRGGVASSGNGGSAKTQTVGSVVEDEPLKKPAVIREESWWGPDPVTGYYMPSDGATGTEEAKLREMAGNKAIKPR